MVSLGQLFLLLILFVLLMPLPQGFQFRLFSLLHLWIRANLRPNSASQQKNSCNGFPNADMIPPGYKSANKVGSAHNMGEQPV